MVGNVTLYNMNTNAICDMLEGQLLPQPAIQLASVLAIMYIGSKKLPKLWLKSTFRVRHRIIYEALVWLKQNNAMYEDIVISRDHLKLLPEDDVPVEISAAIQHEEDEDVGIQERSGYVPTDRIDDQSSTRFSSPSTGSDDMEFDETDTNDASGMVIPMQYLGVMDVDLNNVSLDERMKYALASIHDSDSEGGYAVRHGHQPLSEFGKGYRGQPDPKQNPLAAAFPMLFPYGIGGIEGR
ncbi:hypothetical protein JVU11DRAFT_1099 [Chiua virens]|nr:hypothetical protein JVU11DRAFT_1099 [Chiua virens]